MGTLKQKKKGAESTVSRENKRNPGKRLTALVMIFYFTAFVQLALGRSQWQGFALAIVVPAAIWGGTHILGKIFHIDTMFFSLTNFLCALGILVLYDTNPQLAYHQAVFYGAGLVGMVFCLYFMRAVRSLGRLNPVLICSVLENALRAGSDAYMLPAFNCFL